MKEVEKKDVPDASGGFLPPGDLVSFPLPPIVDPPEFPGTAGPFVPGPEPQLINPISRS